MLGWIETSEYKRNSIATHSVSRMQYNYGFAPVHASAMGYDIPELRHTYKISFKIQIISLTLLQNWLKIKAIKQYTINAV